jgi:DNA processing protein
MLAEAQSENLRNLLALSFLPGIGTLMIKQLVAYTGSPSAVLEAPKRVLEKIPGIGPGLIKSIEEEKELALGRAEEEIRNLEKLGGQCLHYLHPSYPSRLKQISDAPVLLFFKGKIDWENPKTLAIVGTRQATAYGKQALDTFFEEIVSFKPVIVSGLAYGIDIYAHKLALQHGLETWGVMATGIETVYPSVHKATALQMQHLGGVISENPIKTKPDAHRFPARNRIIAGLSDAIFVAEAMEKGGALITARLGLDYNREVFALPGNYNQKASVGCNQLIQKNVAQICTSGLELAKTMGWTDAREKPKKQKVRPENLAEEDHTVLDLMQKEGDLLMDEIAWKTQIPIYQLASQLLNLEFQGLVKSLPGKRFGLSS